MVAQIRTYADDPGLRAALDWAVFAIGALSLSIAIAATVANHKKSTRADAPAVHVLVQMVG